MVHQKVGHTTTLTVQVDVKAIFVPTAQFQSVLVGGATVPLIYLFGSYP